jgi:ATP-dependent protease ClpP protease subunit
MTLHPVRTGGTVINAPQTYRYLADMQDRIVHFITSHSHIAEKALREMLLSTAYLTNDIGTVIAGKEAVAYGLIDEVGGVKEALAALRELCYGEQTKKHP